MILTLIFFTSLHYNKLVVFIYWHHCSLCLTLCTNPEAWPPAVSQLDTGRTLRCDHRLWVGCRAAWGSIASDGGWWGQSALCWAVQEPHPLRAGQQGQQRLLRRRQQTGTVCHEILQAWELSQNPRFPVIWLSDFQYFKISFNFKRGKNKFKTKC